MKGIKRCFWLVGLMIGLVVLVSCGGGDQAELLVGSWDPDPNYRPIIMQFNEDGTYARYGSGERDFPWTAGTYIFDGQHIELIGDAGPKGFANCSDGEREYFEVTNLEANSFTIKILVDECSAESLPGDTESTIKSDIITFERCVDSKVGTSIYYDCLPVDE